jgi:hypothetical protein
MQVLESDAPRAGDGGLIVVSQQGHQDRNLPRDVRSFGRCHGVSAKPV